MAQVRLENVSKRFADVEAVKQFSLEIETGEFVILVGPSGCGKTTLLRIIAGLENLTTGEIYIDDVPITHMPPKKRDIAMVFQNYALYPHKKVFDNLAFCLQIRKKPKGEIQECVRKTAALLGIGELLMRYPYQLSGGQKQRVALGRAIIRNPQVFLFDEPLSNLDAKLRVSMRAELLDLHQRLKTTSIYVTHDQMEAMTMGTRLVIMKDGVVQQVGSPQAVYASPRNLFVAGFIGSPAMNLIEARLTGANEDMSIAASGLNLALPPDKSSALKPYKGKNVILGIRPEHILFHSSGGKADAVSPFQAVVRLIEPLGSEQLVHLQAGENRAIARLDPLIKLAVGQHATFHVRMHYTHLFDTGTGEVIAWQP